MPRLSVIMPAYNGEKNVGTAVRSTLKSMPRDSELVVLDDASEDETLTELRSIADLRLIVRTNSKNEGVSASLAKLLSEVDSAYVARMDADDVCLPWRFRLQIRAMEHNSDVDISFGGAIRFGDGKLPRPTAPLPYGHSLSQALLPLRNPFIHPTMFAKTESLRRAGGYQPGPAEDYDLWMRAAARGMRLRRFSYPVIAYRKHIGQVSGQDKYVQQTISDEKLQKNFESLAEIVYPSVDKQIIWRLLERRLTSGPAINGVTVQCLHNSLCSGIALSRWETFYLKKWLKKVVGEV